MKKEIAERWITELRNPAHKQGFSCLEDIEGGLCCLGVLQKHVLNLPYTPGKDGILSLTEEAVEAADMKSHTGDFPELLKMPSKHSSKNNRNLGALTEMNDDGYTFPEIADFIKKNWKVL